MKRTIASALAALALVGASSTAALAADTWTSTKTEGRRLAAPKVVEPSADKDGLSLGGSRWASEPTVLAGSAWK